jgi:hypothetical protein
MAVSYAQNCGALAITLGRLKLAIAQCRADSDPDSD